MISLSIKTLPDAARGAVLATPIVVSALSMAADSMVFQTVVRAPFKVVVAVGPVEPPQPPAPHPTPTVYVELPVVS